MKRLPLLIAVTIVLATALLVSSVAAGNGNAIPSGPHYNLNLIGAPNEKNANFDGGEGARIFVDRSGVTQFYVAGGNTYDVLDHNGMDGRVGTSQTDPGIIFPYNGTLNPTWRVEIYVRVVGPVGSGTDWTTYKWDGDDYLPYASFSLAKSSKFSLKTGDLLANGYEGMLWDFDPTGKFRICQLRIFLIDE